MIGWCEIRAIIAELNCPIELRYNPNHDSKGRFTSGGSGTKNKCLTKSANSVKLDSNGKPFAFPPIHLDKKEYANLCDEIGRYWNKKYKGNDYCYIEFTNKGYYFENRGIGDYNFYKVKEQFNDRYSKS